MKPEEIVSIAVRTAYCMDLHTYKEIFGKGKRSKWELQQENFTKWYCHLDSGNQKRFMKYAINNK